MAHLPPLHPDPRFEFMGTLILKTMKLKPEKWTKLFGIDESLATLTDFVDNPQPLLLVVVLTNANQLFPVTSFPCYLKNKACYFIKTRVDAIPKENCTDSMVYGELAPKLIDQLASLVNEVFVPLLSNPLNHDGWPLVISQDILKQVHTLKSTVCEVKGKVNNQSILPLPVGVEMVHEAEKAVLKGEEVDLYLKAAIEGVIIKWAQQINDVMTDDSAMAFDNGQNPLPFVELNFWRSRLNNLININDQLQTKRVRCMAVILEKTTSAYYPCFDRLFKNSVSALEEAKEIDMYLRTLEKYFLVIKNIDFSDVQPQFRPLMHTICMIWRDSKFYCNSSKVMVLFKQIGNLLVFAAKKYLNPSTLFENDIADGTQRIQLSMKLLNDFRSTFTHFKDNLGNYFVNKLVVPWSFNIDSVFERLNRFMHRLSIIEWFFKTVLEFRKLENIEIGGFKGKILTAELRKISAEFEGHFISFSVKTYDVLDPDDNRFDIDFKEFQSSIIGLDLKLSTVLVESFDNCPTLDDIYKLIEILGTILDRPLINKDFTTKYGQMIVMLEKEMLTCEELFTEQSQRVQEFGLMEIDTFMPDVAGGILFMTSLAARITKPVVGFRNLPHPITGAEEAIKLYKRYDKLIENIEEFKRKYFHEWALSIPIIIKEKINKNVLARKGDEIILNFDPMVLDIIKEIHLLRHNPDYQNDIPKEGYILFEKRETYRMYRISLRITLDWYNEIRQNWKQVEYDLVEAEANAIDERIAVLENELDWNSEGLWERFEDLNALVGILYERMSKIQKNLREINHVMKDWSGQPLFERKGGRKDTLLNLEDMPIKKSQRYSEIKASAERIRILLHENMQLFNMKNNQDCGAWRNYVAYVDNLLEESLFKCVSCSVGYMSEHMNPKNNLAPLFEAQFELLDPDMIFSPSLDSNNDKGLMTMIKKIIDDIMGMSSLVKRIDISKGDLYEDDIVNSDVIVEMKAEIIKGVNKLTDDANEFCKTFSNYYFLWLEERDRVMDIFLKYGRILPPDEMDRIGSEDPEQPPPIPAKPTMKGFRIQIDKYENLFMEIEEIESYKVFSCWFLVDKRPFRQALLNLVRKWGNMYKEHLLQHVISSLNELSDFIHEVDKGLNEPVPEGDYEALVNTMAHLLHVKDRTDATDAMFKPINDTLEVLRFYDVDIPEQINVLLQELPVQWETTKELADSVKMLVASLQTAEISGIKKRITNFDALVIYYREVFKRYKFFRYDCEDVYYVLARVDLEMSDLELEMRGIQESGSLFEVPVQEFKWLKQCRKELKMLKQLWDYVSIVKSSIDAWKTTPWRKVDVENMDMESKKFAKDIRLLDKEMRIWHTYVNLEGTVKNMLTSLRAVGELQNSALRERHWTQLMTSTKSLAALPAELTIRIAMDPTTPLADLLSLNLHECVEEVKNIVEKAVKELAMEKVLKELEVTWKGLSFHQEPHPRTGTLLLRATDELIENLEENDVLLQNLMTSKYIAHFYKEVSAWLHKLSIAGQVITLWFGVQRTWSHLESIFMSSEDIRKKLPDDSVRFERIDSNFKSMSSEMSDTLNVVKGTNRKGLVERLEFLQQEMLVCEKALAEYLETKRLAFPRFYFISSTDLLDILSNGDLPEMVIRHLTKLFDSMAKLKFVAPENPDNKTAVGMFAKDGEYVQFHGTSDCSGPVELWLKRLQDIMRSSLRQYFGEAVISLEDKPRELWLFDFMAQVSLCGSQIWWTTEVNMAFSRIEGGLENALKDFYKKQMAQLSTLITLLVGELTKQDRQKIMTICTIDVHSRDVVNKLILAKLETGSAFEWQSQLRHRWDKDENHCFANICDAQFRYSYEYLGNTPRLVITPLTDRCYITLTQSLHLIMGGGPAGPAGTGKTETTKDLGRALGIMVYVFNCSEQLDYQSCGSIYKGLAQTGAWGCFDEFNRISVEVLSVVAVQVKSVQDAIRDKKETFNFMGENIVLVPSVGIFVTMNPGYAGRTELPENLKALFRPCAMVVPNFELICEIMLIAEGFQEAKVLARKFITLYKLCKELLSKQDHYDWGLRAIKSVLVVAGSLKRAEPDRPEEEVLMRTLRDFNVPKVVVDDVSVFLGLIGDLFPTLDVERRRDIEFEKSVKQAAVDRKLQPEDNFILKVVQLEELLEVRHSVFVVGNTGSGKTEVWRTLFKTYQNLKMKPVYNDLNPKAVTNDELFGIINPATRDWKDGLFSVIMREQANIPGNRPRWIVLDGDIDPMWIESLNTVMDDNKILTLASNERIPVTPTMRLMFEISNLRTATPATVSRAGILYINSEDVGWNPYLASWIETRTLPDEKENLINLIDDYVPTCMKAIAQRFKKITPIPEMAHIQMLCHLLENLFIPENTPAGCPKEWHEIYFVFACVWAFGSSMYLDGVMDYRLDFSKWWMNEFTNVPFPPGGTVFDFYVDAKKQFQLWVDKITKYELDTEIPLQAVLVPTAETIRIRFFLDLLMKDKHPVMLIGCAGSGKTVMVNEKLQSLPVNYAIQLIPFNFYTSAEMLQKILEKPLEKKSGRNYGPKDNKNLIYFIDDMNMPEVDEYGTVQAHTIIRQHMDYKHWYDRSKLTLKDIHNTQYVSCMNPTSGSFTINPRLQRHFSVFAISFPNNETLHYIYQSILYQHLLNPEFKINPEIIKISSTVVDITILLHHKMLHVFLPTADKFHYIFNLRDLSNIFQGFLFSTNECLTNPSDILRLWLHETHRVYGDRLNDDKDIDQFQKIQVDILQKNFEELEDHVVFKKPNVYCHFVEGLGDPKYLPVDSWEQLNKILMNAMASYNELNTPMGLVFFEDAMWHVCRINRVLECPRGSALLVGVGGSGKQSLSRLAAFISGLEVVQIQLKKGYGVMDLKSELNGLYIKSGLKNVGIMFLMTDAQVPREQFLVLINDLLSSGEVADLFSDDEVENIQNGLKNEVKVAGLPDTRESCWKFFIDRVRKMLKVVLCFSPVGSTLRVRARKFPALINGTSINWFHDWPQDALESVAMSFFVNLHVLPEELRESIAKFMSFVHTSVNTISRAYMANDRRYNYTTPKSFLEQISMYSKLMINKTEDLQAQIVRLKAGLEKLRVTAIEVAKLKEILAVQEVELGKKNEIADKLIESVGIETAKVTAEKEAADDEEERVFVITDEVKKKQKTCAIELIKAEPALNAAKEALNTLNKTNLTELKSFGSPVDAVANVMSAVIVLFAPNGKVPKDRSWKVAKSMMIKVDVFLDSLINYDKENIHADVIKAIRPYLKDPEFEPGFVRAKSVAAAGLCEWVINIIKFYEVFCTVLPKRKALQDANDELHAARENLKRIKAKVIFLEELLANLTAAFADATAEKMKCQAEADATNAVISLANRLINGLASEKVRWAESVANFLEQNKVLPGDMLLITAFISYMGYFTKQYRLDLMNKQWLVFMKKLDPKIPITPGMDPLTMLTDDTQIAIWQNEGLPSDRMSTENATIICNSDRWPLMVDPQLQGVKWIKQKYGDKLIVLRPGQRGCTEALEKAVVKGDRVLLENIGETLDPVLDSLLGRNLIKKGKIVKIGDKEVEYNPNFRLILHTKLANPHYKPEMQAQTTLVNFTVTRDGLEDQLLAEVVKAERPDLEESKANLTRQQNQFMITLNKLEADLLARLNSAGDDILEDKALVENLESTKKTSSDIKRKVAEAKVTSQEIDDAREFYRAASARGSLLYFILNDLNAINPLYQFSLEAFTVVFLKAISRAKPATELEQRMENLIDSITFSVYHYTSRGLFECDKLIFAAQMTFQILLMSEELAPEEVDFFLRFPVKPHVASPVDFLSHHSWGGVCSLSAKYEFTDFDRDVESSPLKWKKVVEKECPEREPFPDEWKTKTPFQRICMMRALRPDRMTYALADYIEITMGAKYVENRTMEFSKSFEEMSSTTPIFFILSPGVNPLKDVEALGKVMGYTIDNGNFHNVSLGQGQEIIAEQAFDVGLKEGHWVVLQNIHLVKKWLPSLEKKMETFSSGCHDDFRLFMSAEPAPTIESHIIPQGILESSIKITNEPPTGMLANMHKALDNFSQETLDMCSKEDEFKGILFALCYFHAVVAERRKFGPQGWNRHYPFNVGDLTISVLVLHNYLEANEDVPWEDLRFLFGEIMYGGHITDDWDRVLCNAYLEELMQQDLVDGELYFAPGFLAPPALDYAGYHQYIEDALPPESPYLYGLHPNAEIGFLTTTSDNLFKTIFELQPRDAQVAAGGTKSRDEKVKTMLDEIMDKLTIEFNMPELIAKVEDKTPYIIVAFQECERMNYLTGEMRRSLKELDMGLKGELTITSVMEEIENALFLDQVPHEWENRAYPSLLGLSAWFADLCLRMKELESWSVDFILPASVWLPGFFNPQSFLTAIMQSTARQYELPLDKMCLQCNVTMKMKKEFTIADCRTGPGGGAFVHGLMMEGARWDLDLGFIVESKMKDLFPMMPVINIRAITQEKQDLTDMYLCPVYRTRTRGPTYVWTFNLNSNDKPSKWILAGVALLLQI